jgi:arabinogalactan endo-1,4-beta-galactosidase
MKYKMNMIQKYKATEIYLQNADHIDIKTVESDVDLRSFVSGMLSYYPWWMVSLYKIREVLVGILGLARHEKPETLPSIKPEDLSFKPDEKASFFIVRDAKEDMYWVSETPEDKHLTAYFGVIAEKLSQNRTRYHVFTSVKYLHWTGPVYFNLIRPFHHIVVKSMIKAGARKWTRS